MAGERDSQHKQITTERVVFERGTASVSNNLQEQTAYHADHEAPGAMADAQKQLDRQQKAEDDGNEDIAAKRWSVAQGRF